MTGAVFAAVDIGASGGRVVAGTITTDGGIDLHPVHRFPNGAANMDGHLRWNFTRLANQVRAGLAKIPEVTSIGISTWAVDYGLLDEDRHLLAEPVSYRDDRTDAVIDDVHQLVAPEELYRINGLQFLPFNTIYQLAVERQGPLWDRAAHIVLIPDLVAHQLTGALGTEVTNASTTGLLDATTRRWSADLLHRLDIPADRLPPLDSPGDRRGTCRDGTPVISIGSHDTASAVVGAPATTRTFAYISSGTWSLVGLELPDPVLTDDARQANFTNEGGVDGRTRFLRNVGGLWLLQECMREWQRDDLDVLLAEATRLPTGGPIIDADDTTFIPPGDMPNRICTAAGETDMAPGRIVRCILDSLAAGYARTLTAASTLAGRSIDVVHIVGGGSQNQLLCQLTAEATGLPVLAGPVEATARGSIIVQARTAGILPDSLDDIRAQMAATLKLRRYEPR